MGLSRRTASRTTSNLRTEIWTKSFPLLVALISASTFLISCATPDVLGDKEEYARQSGKGGVIGIHQGLESIDDPLVTKLRTALLQDEFLQRLVTQLAQAAVVGARQGVSDLHPDQSAAAITEAIAATLDRHLEQTGLRLLRAAESAAYRTSLRTVRESVLVAADSFAIASPQYSAAMRNVVGSSVDGALDALSERLEKRTGELLKDELPRFVGIISRTAAREAVGGFKQGIREEFPELLPRQFWSDWVRIALIAGSTMLLILLIVAGIVIVPLARSDRLGRQALFIIAQKVEQHGSPELKAAIYQSGSAEGGESWLAEFLRRRGV